MNNRLKILKVFVTGILIILILRAGHLQLIMGRYYYELSEGNRLSERPISAPRGKMLDQDRNVLVSNKEAYNLYIMPNEVPPEVVIDEILMNLEELTGMDSSIMKENYDRKESNSSGILIKRNISRETMVIIQENNDALPGIFIDASSMREYVYGNLAAHFLGYVGEISLDELKNYSRDDYIYRGGDIVGKTGLEKEYEPYLKGENGIELIEVNSRGEKAKTISIKPPLPGNDLILNLDLELQQYVEKVLEEELYRLRELAESDPELFPPTGAAAIVMDPQSGKILSIVSVPKYDPNRFACGISYDDYALLNDDPLMPLYNRPIMSQVNPGSIFKLVTGTAAIENLGVTADTIFVDNTGKYTIGEWEYRNWLTYGEGKLSFIRAIARSNNVVFYQLGHRLYKEFGGDMLAWTARQYGFGSKTGIDLPGEKEGLVPDNEWKLSTEGEIWYPGDAVHLSIGQKITTTPVQLLNFVSAVANGGTLYRPYMVDKVLSSENETLIDYKPEIIRKLPFRKSTYDILKKGMYDVTNASYGTASKYFTDLPIKVAGKTGTAQTSAVGANHGWFAGFAPADEPEVAVLVFLQEGNSSSYTLPIASNIFEKYFFPELNDEKEDTKEDFDLF